MTKFRGTKNDDTLHHNLDGNDKIYAGQGDDFIRIGVEGTNNHVYGGAGDDVVKIKGMMADYTVTETLRGNLLVEDGDGNRVILHNVETLKFKDGTYVKPDNTLSDQTLSDRQTDADGTLLVNGVPGEHFHQSTYSPANITTSLAAHQYGNVYSYDFVSGSTYAVQDGMSSINANRADWSFAMSVENNGALTLGDATTKGDYDVGIWIDIDNTDAEQFVFIGNLEEIADSATADAGVFQNSWNFNFDFIKSQLDPSYADNFEGDAKFGIELRLTDTLDGRVVDTNHIDVVVF